MGSIRLEMSGGVVGSTKGRTYTVPDADINRLVEWAQAKFAEQGQTPTVLEALLAWAQLVIDRTRDDVLRYEREVMLSENEPPPFTAT